MKTLQSDLNKCIQNQPSYLFALLESFLSLNKNFLPLFFTKNGVSA